MNGGNRDRGQADGFGLEILNKLKDVKGKDSGVNLLDFVVKMYIKKYYSNIDSLEKVSFPLVEPADIEKCSLVVFNQIEEELCDLGKKIKKTENLVTNIMDREEQKHSILNAVSEDGNNNSKDSLEHVKIFKERIEHAKQRLNEQEDNLKECQKM